MLLMLGLAPHALVSRVHAQAPGAVTPATFFTSPLEPPTSIPTATWTPAPTPTVTATPTPTTTPTATPTATYPAYQVSPLLLQPGPARTPGNDALLWIGGATLLVLAGSVILVLGRRQGEA